MSRPHPNTYLVPGGRLFAGEYPYTPDAGTGHQKLREFIAFGITAFIDLTAEGELLPYDAALRRFAAEEGREIEYHRLPIRDMGIPIVQRMPEVLDKIDRVEESGGVPYVHCWGGVGRTGTVVGCYLVRRGADPDDALATVAALFATMTEDKIGRHPEGSPQTREQRDFVRGWEPSARSVFRAGARAVRVQRPIR